MSLHGGIYKYTEFIVFELLLFGLSLRDLCEMFYKR